MTKAPTFDEFWKAYPLHKAKGAAERAWSRLSARDRRKALAGIPRYRVYCKQEGVSYKYAHGWLSDRRWEDEYADQADGSPSCPGPAGHAGAGTGRDDSPTLPPSRGAIAEMDTW